MKRKIWIGLEGISGCGKTTQLKLLKLNLPNLFPTLKFQFVEEFSNRDNGLRLRMYLNEKPNCFSLIADADQSTTHFHLLTIADRFEAIKLIFKTSESEIIILDRFLLSDVAHLESDNFLGSNEMEFNKVISSINSSFNNQILREIKKNAYHIYLDCSLENSIYRIKQRRNFDISLKQIDFLDLLKNSYNQLIKDKQRIYSVDANQSKQKLNKDLINIIRLIIENNRK